MRFTLDGKECDFAQRLGFNEAVIIQRLTNYKPVAWEKALAEYDALALAALILVYRNRNGENLTSLDEVDNDLLTFEVLDEPDPTEVAAASKPSATSTSGSSRSSSRSARGSGTTSTTSKS